jgi:hypothetical protein
MIDFNTFFSTIYDKSKSIGHRTAVFFSMVGLIMIVELIFNFTYDIYISNKLNNLNSIHELKEIYKNDSLETEKLRKDEIRILNRWHYSEFLPFFNYSKTVETDTLKIKTTQFVENKPLILNKEDSIKMKQLLEFSVYCTANKDYTKYLHFFDSLKTSQQRVIEKTEIKTSRQINNKPKVLERSKLWMFISSNYFFLLFSLLFWIFPWFSKDQKKGSLFIGIFASQVILILLMMVVYWTAYFIPLILGNPFYNYVLNAIIHLLIVTFGIRIIMKASTKK